MKHTIPDNLWLSRFIKLSDSFFADKKYADSFARLGLVDIDSVFSFTGGIELAKPGLASHRSRLQFDLPDKNTTVFLKRYNNTPILQQIKNYILHHHIASSADFDRLPAAELQNAGINTPRVLAFGSQWKRFFEKRSFIVTEKIADAQSLEKHLPCYFYNSAPLQNVNIRREFINRLADFARAFHDTGWRHRDFYFAHIFMDAGDNFHLIDLQRCSRPILFGRRLKLKDLTQLYYSAPGNILSRADRLRFYLRYRRIEKLSRGDRIFIKLLKAKAWRMADRDIHRERSVPFAL